MKRIFSTIFLSAVTLAAPSWAITINPLAPASGYNVFVEGDSTITKGHLDGGLVTGGNLNVKGDYEIGSKISGKDALVVGGKVNLVSGGTVYIQNSNTVFVGDTSNVKVWEKDGNNASMNTQITKSGSGVNSNPRIELRTKQTAADINSSNVIDIAASFASLEANSLALATIEGTTPVIPANGKITFNLTAGQNVFDLTGAQLASLKEIKFSMVPSAANPVLFNVAVGSADLALGLQFAGIGDDQAAYILFNFYDATGTITLGNGGSTMIGAILAPNATVKDLSNSNVTGQIVAKAFEHNGAEIHHRPFSATFDIPPPPPVPDNGSMFALLGATLVAIEVMRRYFLRGARLA